MIFDINDIAPKIIKKRRRHRTKLQPTHPLLPPLSIVKKTSQNKKTAAIFEIVKSQSTKRKKIAKIIVDKKALNKNSTKILLALLYWSGGAKYPSSNFISFSNSDPSLVKSFLTLLRSTFPIQNLKIKIHLQIRKNDDQKKIENFWSHLLGVTRKQFYKPTISKTSATARRQNYYGTCTVRYYNLEFLLTLTEIYEELSKIL